MATIKQFKQEIANLVKAQKAAKNINDCSSVYYNRGRLHAMYVADEEIVCADRPEA